MWSSQARNHVFAQNEQHRVERKASSTISPTQKEGTKTEVDDNPIEEIEL